LTLTGAGPSDRGPPGGHAAADPGREPAATGWPAVTRSRRPTDPGLPRR